MIKKGDFVKICYTAKLEDGTVIDSTDENVAKEHRIYTEGARYGDIIVVVGEGHVVQGLDEALEGKEVGYKGSIEVPPEKAFGEYNPDNREFVSISKFRERPIPGQRVRIGDKVGTVEKVIGRRVIVDYNHPLAGKKIIFDFEIKEKIEGIDEKIKSLFTIYTGREINVKIEDSKAIIEVPKDAVFSQYFMLGKFTILNQIFKHIPEINEVVFVERFEREKQEETQEKSQLDKT
uniref:Peptidyl-prolyl cis-trans isomerase n=1 Tax=Geoglobus ahangari TaxID=113653 RepID=A0A7C3YP46_9EURY